MKRRCGGAGGFTDAAFTGKHGNSAHATIQQQMQLDMQPDPSGQADLAALFFNSCWYVIINSFLFYIPS